MPVTTRNTDRRRLRSVLVVAGAGATFAILTVVVRLSWAPLQSADAAVARNLNSLVASRPGLVRVLTAITNLGSATVLFWLVTLAVILLTVRRRYRLAGYLAVAALGSLVLNVSLKALIGRLRPVVPDPVAVGGGDSFPSGHALESMICYGALVLVFLPAVPRRWRRVLPAVAATVVVLVGVSRIMLGVHFVSDVVGAWSLGIAWLGLTVYAFEINRHHAGRPVPQPLAEGIEPEAAADVAPAASTSAPPAVRAAGAGSSEGPAEGGGRPLREAAWLVIGWVLVLGLLVGLGELVVRGGDNLLGDRSIPHWLAAHRSAALNSVSDFWSQAGNTHAIMAVGLVAGAIVLGLARRWRPVIFLVVLMMGELGLFLAAAKVVGRDRPDVAHLDGPLPTSAYPSGHVAATLCLYAGLALLVLTSTRAWWRWLAVVPAVAMTGLVAAARLYRGMHHPTDELASVVLAAAWIAVTYLVLRPSVPRLSPQGTSAEPSVHSRPARTAQPPEVPVSATRRA